MDCAMCVRLTDECERLKWSYGMAVDHLFAIGYLATDAEYRGLKASVEDAKLNLEFAQRELEKHQQALALTLAASW